MNKNIIQEFREFVSLTEREKARLDSPDYPTDEEIRHLRRSIESGIHLAQQRLVARAKREGFTLITCPHPYTKVIEVTPDTIIFPKNDFM